MPLKDLGEETLPEAARPAFAHIVPAQRFLYDFTKAVYKDRSYSRLRIEEEDFLPALDLLDNDGMSARIVGVEEGEMPAAYLDFCAARDEEDNYRTRAIVEWRMDLQHPATIDYTMPGQDIDTAKFLLLSYRPQTTSELSQALRTILPPELTPEVKGNGERIYFSVTQERLLSKVLAKMCYRHLGEIIPGHHVYGNCESLDVLVRTSRFRKFR